MRIGIGAMVTGAPLASSRTVVRIKLLPVW